ncbi:hypothetical protein LPTSP4_36170 [Leptospira ryugenii]|uniref:Uncharacterized protein n=1 Tax=Leptospira ryugenii TaxID=1917863 RepID=A0A2P2E5C5_9LEPT|nr:hypothetical protein [Leptospira ryugenii]GBF52079.1 hypothetical protein LPTSP4_36170 [Leptospira ryugenii]
MENNIKVNYKDSVAGWIHVDVISQEDIWQIRASDWLDPFPELIGWLEQIIEGQKFCSFFIDEEGSGTTLSYEKINDNKCNFKLELTDAYNKIHLLMNPIVNTYTLVSEFYNGLLDFSKSDRYIKSEWEADTLSERLKNVLDLDKDVDLENLLINYHSDQINQILNLADPLNYEYFETKEKLKLYLNELTPGQPIIKSEDHFPYIGYSLNKKFNEVNLESKRIILQEMLTNRTNGFSGLRLSDRKSLKIELWLTENRMLMK